MFRIVIVLAIVAALSMLVDPVSTEAPGTARSSPWIGMLAAWAEPAPALAQEARSGIRARARCAECGVIESSSDTETPNEVAELSTESAAAGISSGRTITVRLADGSRRVIGDSMSAHWRVRERVIVIGGLAADR
jgi:hypothetical protein